MWWSTDAHFLIHRNEQAPVLSKAQQILVLQARAAVQLHVFEAWADVPSFIRGIPANWKSKDCHFWNFIRELERSPTRSAHGSVAPWKLGGCQQEFWENPDAWNFVQVQEVRPIRQRKRCFQLPKIHKLDDPERTSRGEVYCIQTIVKAAGLHSQQRHHLQKLLQIWSFEVEGKVKVHLDSSDWQPGLEDRIQLERDLGCPKR